MEASTTVRVEEEFPVTPAELWNAWTDPRLVMQWFGSDPAGKVLEAILVVRPGGRFTISFKDGDDTEHTCSGIYQDVVQFRKLSFTFTWKIEPGTEALIVLTFTALGGYTRLLLEHHNPGSAALHNYEKGWRATLAKLRGVLAAGAPNR